MASGDVWAVKMRFFLADSGKTIAPGFSLQEGAAAPLTVAQVQAKVVTFWDAIKSLYAPTQELTNVTLRRMVPLSNLEESDASGLPSPGTATNADDLSPSTAIVVSQRTQFIGRRFRGRTYLPNPSEGAADGNLDSTAAQTIADAYLAMVSSFALDSMPIAVWSRINTVATPVTDILVDRRLRTQRRRQQRPPTYTAGV